MWGQRKDELYPEIIHVKEKVVLDLKKIYLKANLINADSPKVR